MKAMIDRFSGSRRDQSGCQNEFCKKVHPCPTSLQPQPEELDSKGWSPTLRFFFLVVKVESYAKSLGQKGRVVGCFGQLYFSFCHLHIVAVVINDMSASIYY